MALADTDKVERANFVFGPDREITGALLGVILNAKAPSASDRVEAYERFRVAEGTDGSRIKIRDYGLVRLDHLVTSETTFPPAFAMTARTNRKLGI